MARGIVASGQEDIVIDATLERLVKRNGLTEELLLDPAKSIKTGLELEVVVAVRFGNGGHDGDVVALGADVVCGGDDGDVDV